MVASKGEGVALEDPCQSVSFRRILVGTSRGLLLLSTVQGGIFVELERRGRRLSIVLPCIAKKCSPAKVIGSRTPHHKLRSPLPPTQGVASWERTLPFGVGTTYAGGGDDIRSIFF